MLNVVFGRENVPEGYKIIGRPYEWFNSNFKEEWRFDSIYRKLVADCEMYILDTPKSKSSLCNDFNLSEQCKSLCAVYLGRDCNVYFNGSSLCSECFGLLLEVSRCCELYIFLDCMLVWNCFGYFAARVNGNIINDFLDFEMLFSEYRLSRYSYCSEYRETYGLWNPIIWVYRSGNLLKLEFREIFERYWYLKRGFIVFRVGTGESISCEDLSDIREIVDVDYRGVKDSYSVYILTFRR